jgi:hypothetical protein
MDPEEKEDKMMYTKRRLLNDSTTLLFSEWHTLDILFENL